MTRRLKIVARSEAVVETGDAFSAGLALPARFSNL